MTPLVADLIAALKGAQITFTHWKGSFQLDRVLDGEGDIDLLIKFDDRQAAMAVLETLGFRRAYDRGERDVPYVEHHFGYDPDVSRTIHLHLYYRLTTAGSLIANRRLPFEPMLFAETVDGEGGLPAPRPEAALLVVVVRRLLEMLSPLEHLVFYKDRRTFQGKLLGLMQSVDATALEATRARWMPGLDAATIGRGIDALSTGDVWSRIAGGLRAWRHYPITLEASPIIEMARAKVVVRAVLRGRLGVGRRRSRSLVPGGVVIAFTPMAGDAAGTASAIFDHSFAVMRVDMGRRQTLVGKMVAAGLAVFRRAGMAAERLAPAEALCEALDRLLLARKCIRLAVDGSLVLIENYPEAALTVTQTPTIPAMAAWRSACYQRMPLPDAVMVASPFTPPAPMRAGLRVIDLGAQGCASEIGSLVWACWGGGNARRPAPTRPAALPVPTPVG